MNKITLVLSLTVKNPSMEPEGSSAVLYASDRPEPLKNFAEGQLANAAKIAGPDVLMQGIKWHDWGLNVIEGVGRVAGVTYTFDITPVEVLT